MISPGRARSSRQESIEYESGSAGKGLARSWLSSCKLSKSYDAGRAANGDAQNEGVRRSGHPSALTNCSFRALIPSWIDIVEFSLAGGAP